MNSCARSLLVLVPFVSLLCTQPLWAEPPKTCDTPYDATESLFGWLQPDTYHPNLAATCLDPRTGTKEELQSTAKRVKAVYDAKALYVEVDKLSREPDWKDADTGRAQFAPHPGLPKVVVARQSDGQWRWTKESINEINEIYEELFSVLDDDALAHLPSWLRGTLLGIQAWQYLALGLLIILGLVVYKVVNLVVAARIRKLAERFGQQWASNVIAVLSSPLAALILGMILWLSYPILRLPVQASIVLSLAARTLIIFSIVWAAYRLVDVVAEVFADKARETETKLDDQLVPLLRKSSKVLVVVAGALLVLQNLNVNVASLLAGLGIGGLAFAFAAKDTLANFFGSVMIFLDNPFQIGDWIVVDGTEGVVEEVGFRSTRIRTFYNSLIVIPNSKFTDRPIDNYGARRYRRIFTTLNLTYDTTPEQMQAFVEGVRAIIKANPNTRKDYYEVHMSGFGAHSLDVMLYFFFEVPTWSDELRERHNVFLEVMRLAKDLGVEFAFPTTTMHVEALAAPGRARRVPHARPATELGEVVLSYGPGGTRARPAGPQIAGGLYAASEEVSRGSEADGEG